MTRSDTPLFSIVTPTRNRAPLLRHALSTALGQVREDGQPFDDVEIVVVDNASSDDTPHLVEELADPRVRYVRTDSVLPMADNWDLAVSRARGEWIIVLPDDDGFVPTLLQRLRQLIDGGAPNTIAWARAWYVHSGFWPDPEEANRLIVWPHRGTVEPVDCAWQLARFFERRETLPNPGMIYSAARRSVFDAVHAATGRYCAWPDPAATFCAALLALEDQYLAVDLPMTLQGVSDASISTGFIHNMPERHEVVREFDSKPLFQEVPLRSRTMQNLVSESLLNVKRSMPGLLGHLELDPVRYFVVCYEELADPGRRAPSDAGLREWRQVVARQPWSVRARVKRDVATYHLRRGVRGFVRSSAERFGTVEALRRLARGGRKADLHQIDGDDAGFADLPGAAGYLDSRYLPALTTVR